MNASAKQHDMHQLVRVIQQSLPAGNYPVFHPSSSLAFPSSDITEYTAHSDRPRIELSCLALIGVSSPLPHYFITDALDEDNDSLRAFLGIFNQVIYRTYFKAWKHKHPELFHDHALRANALICSLGTEDIRCTDPMAQTSHLFLYQRRHYYGLVALLEILFPKVPSKINLHNHEWLETIALVKLGSKVCPGRLNDNITLGKKILCHAHRISIELGPIRSVDLVLRNRISWIHRYLNHELALEIHWLIDPIDARSQLGSDLCLGWTSTLGTRTQILKKGDYAIHACE